MYQHKFAEQRQHLFRPEHAEELKQAHADMEARLPALLINAGFPEEHIPIIKDLKAVALDCVRWGHFPLAIQVNHNVVKDAPDPELFACQHERVQASFEKEFQYFIRPFYQFTMGEQWWSGEPLFLVNDATSYLMHTKYSLEARFEDVRDWRPKKRGRPRNDAAHAAKAEQASRYKEWIESCRAYKQELQDKTDELRDAEIAVKPQVEAIERECAARIAEVQKVIQEQRVALNMLKARGAPKWMP
jgi:hypothetical protein